MPETDKKALFREFVQHFPETEQKVLLSLYTHIVGKKVISYKFKDRTFTIPILRTQAFSMAIAFENVLIENGRHPKEARMLDLRGEALPNGRYVLRFLNGQTEEGQEPKENAFSFDRVQAEVKLWDYQIHQLTFPETAERLPWLLVNDTLAAMEEKGQMLGDDFLNEGEQRCLVLYRFFKPYLNCYLDRQTRVGFGKSTVLYDRSFFGDMPDEESRKAMAGLLISQGFKELGKEAEQGDIHSPDFIRGLFYSMRAARGEGLYQAICRLIHQGTSQYQDLSDPQLDVGGLRSRTRDELDRLFSECGWRGRFPHYRKTEKPGFVEVSDVYSRKYAYLNEKTKILYMDFLESMSDGRYAITPLAGVCLPKNMNDARDLQEGNGIRCCFLDGGRRNAQMITDLAITDRMDRQEIEEKFRLLQTVIR